MIEIAASAPGATVGSDPAEEGRQTDEARHAVQLKAFAIGRREVTVAQYAQCVAAGACRSPEWDDPTSEDNVRSGKSSYYKALGEAVTAPDRAVVGVSWDDASAYVAWLSKVTGDRFRLPSETEWEYAVRAGSTTRFWWGDEIAPGRPMASCSGCGSPWDRKGAAPAGAFRPNPWGLENGLGNVWEWTADSYCPDFDNSPADGSPRDGGACGKAGDFKVLRGGSSFSPVAQVRSSVRLRNVRAFRNSSVGFRVVRLVDR